MRWLALVVFISSASSASATPTLPEEARAQRSSASELDRSAWAEYSRAGREHLRMGETRNAEEAFLIALSVATDHPPQKQRLATALFNLERIAALYRSTNDAEGLVRIGPYLVDAAARLNGGNDADVITHLRTLASAHAAMGDYEQSQTVFGDALNASIVRNGENSIALADIHQHRAAVALEEGDLATAETSLVRATQLAEQHRGSDHQSLAPLLAMTAELRTQQGFDDQAEGLHLRGLELSEDGEENHGRRQQLEALARFYLDRNRASEAEPLLSEALEIDTATTPAARADLLDAHADALQALDRLPEAQIRLEEAVALDPTGTDPAFDEIRLHYSSIQLRTENQQAAKAQLVPDSSATVSAASAPGPLTESESEPPPEVPAASPPGSDDSMELPTDARPQPESKNERSESPDSLQKSEVEDSAGVAEPTAPANGDEN